MGRSRTEDRTVIRSLSWYVVAMYTFGIARGRGSVTNHTVSTAVLETMRATGSARTDF
jgi:hypothetical protein